ncbi:Retrovirus-related Pol polyprotein from transposon TNT 1-94 [Nymphaea thermarum]|nr:Retrovirus-related Pol polyprotein from transposon TNT 1-94 [Nymphaea thermarum]
MPGKREAAIEVLADLQDDPLYGIGGIPKCSLPELRDERIALDGGYCRPTKPIPGDCGYQLHAYQLIFAHPVTNKSSSRLLFLSASSPPERSQPPPNRRQLPPSDRPSVVAPTARRLIVCLLSAAHHPSSAFCRPSPVARALRPSHRDLCRSSSAAASAFHLCPSTTHRRRPLLTACLPAEPPPVTFSSASPFSVVLQRCPPLSSASDSRLSVAFCRLLSASASFSCCLSEAFHRQCPHRSPLSAATCCHCSHCCHRLVPLPPPTRGSSIKRCCSFQRHMPSSLKAYRDMLMVGVFLSGLDSVYESAKNQMLTSPSIPPIDEAYSRLSRIPIFASTVPDTTSAMLATRGRGGPFFARGRGGRGRGSTTSRPVCQFCHRIGHTVDKCWQKHGRPAFANQTVSTDSSEQPKTQHTASSSELRVDDILSQLRNLIGDRTQQAPDPTTSAITTAASASSSGMSSSPVTDTTDWLIDSGASTHLCGDKAQFTSYVSTPPGRSVILADGNYSPVVGHEKVQLTSSLLLQHVLHAPEFPHSLLSISQITRDLNCRAIFDSSSLVFQDILTGRVIGSGHEQGGLYRLVQPFPFVASTSSGSSSSSAYTWHLRFGHLPFQRLLHVLPQLSPKSSFLCESCQLGKHHRSSFPPRFERSSHSVFELLHFDVWGPSRTPDLQGHRYYFVAVDDYSRVSWVFLMKHKSEAGHVIKNFINEILTQFDTCVKIVRSDNALEFCASSLEQFFRDKGIIHQTSCAYTSQQNGVVERKHRHILDVARTIIIHSHVPHSYWGDAVLTACYLINRMPSSVLGDLIPFSVLFPDRALFLLLLVFLAVLPLFTCLVLGEISCLLGPSKQSLLVIPALKRDIAVMILLLVDTM